MMGRIKMTAPSGFGIVLGCGALILSVLPLYMVISIFLVVFRQSKIYSLGLFKPALRLIRFMTPMPSLSQTQEPGKKFQRQLTTTKSLSLVSDGLEYLPNLPRLRYSIPGGLTEELVRVKIRRLAKSSAQKYSAANQWKKLVLVST